MKMKSSKVTRFLCNFNTKFLTRAENFEELDDIQGLSKMLREYSKINVLNIYIVLGQVWISNFSGFQ